MKELKNCCICAKFTRNAQGHCDGCYALYVQKKLYVNGQWWHVKTSGVMDVWVFPVLAWELISPAKSVF